MRLSRPPSLQPPARLLRPALVTLLFAPLVLARGASDAPVNSPSNATVYSRGVTVTPLLKTRTDAAGQPLVYPAGAPAEITAVLVEIAPGQQTNWHHHPMPCVAYVLEGEVRVELAGGETKTLKAGEAFTEAVGVLHNGTNPGPQPARLVLFALGTAGQPYAVKATIEPNR